MDPRQSEAILVDISNVKTTIHEVSSLYRWCFKLLGQSATTVNKAHQNCLFTCSTVTLFHPSLFLKASPTFGLKIINPNNCGGELIIDTFKLEQKYHDLEDLKSKINEKYSK